MFFSYDNRIIYPVHISSEKFSDSMDLLLIFEENKSHYVYIKDFNRLKFNKSKNKNKKYFCRYCLQCFSSESILTEHKENCLVINGKQCVKLSKGFISFKNYCRQTPVPFKIYADFEYILKEIKYQKKLLIKIVHTLKHIKLTYRVVLVTKLFVLTIDLVKIL